MTTQKINLKKALGAWLLTQPSPAIKIFAQRLGYTYQYAWQLASGKKRVSSAIICAIAREYGEQEAVEFLKLAGLPGIVSLEIVKTEGEDLHLITRAA